MVTPCVEMSVPELHSKIIELQEQLQYLRHLAKTKVIEQMKKYKQVSLLQDLILIPDIELHCHAGFHEGKRP
jgi:hypothetical protein